MIQCGTSRSVEWKVVRQVSRQRRTDNAVSLYHSRINITTTIDRSYERSKSACNTAARESSDDSTSGHRPTSREIGLYDIPHRSVNHRNRNLTVCPPQCCSSHTRALTAPTQCCCLPHLQVRGHSRRHVHLRTIIPLHFPADVQYLLRTGVQASLHTDERGQFSSPT